MFPPTIQQKSLEFRVSHVLVQQTPYHRQGKIGRRLESLALRDANRVLVLHSFSERINLLANFNCPFEFLVYVLLRETIHDVVTTS